MVDQKRFYHQSRHDSLLLLPLEDNNFNAMFYHLHFQKIIQKAYLLPENMDELSDLNICFVHMFLDLIDICSS